MKQKSRRLFSILLTLMLMLGMLQGMGFTALADGDDPYAALVNTTNKVEFNGYDWYVIADDCAGISSGTVTLLSADNSFGCSIFADSWSNAYSDSKVKADLDAMTSTGDFMSVADAIAVTSLSDVSVSEAKLYLLDKETAKALPRYILASNFTEAASGAWWLRTAGTNASNTSVAFVSGNNDVSDGGATGKTTSLGVRPALRLDLSKVVFSSIKLSGGANTVVSGGSAVQNYFDYGSTRSDMATVTYTAVDTYEFPETSDYYGTVNGITVERINDKEVTVSGKLDGVAAAEITVPDAVDPTVDVWEGSGTDSDPYQISDEEDLEMLAELVNKGIPFINTYFVMTDDITLTDVWTPIGFSKRANYTVDSLAPYFAGSFDGNGKTITGLTNQVDEITYTPIGDSLKTDEYVYGLFGVIGNGAVIKDLTLSDVDIDTTRTEGLKGDSVGAVVGYAFGTATISGVSVSGSVKAADAVGGVVGRCYQVDSNAQRAITITDCSASDMTVTATGAKAGGIAGFVGDSNKGHYTITVTGNSFDGTVTSTDYNSPIAVFGAFLFIDNEGVLTPNSEGNQAGNEYNISGNTTNTGKTTLKSADTLFILDPHVHDLTFARGEDPANIIATCSVEDGCCGIANGILALVIVKPTMTTDVQTGEGISAEATLDGLDDFNTAAGMTIAETDIRYYMATVDDGLYIKGDELEAAPSDAGDYIAEITITNVKTSEGEGNSITARVGYTIEVGERYSNEWVDGIWYEKDGSQTYEWTASWERDGKEWMYVDESGWYPKNRWQKIDSKWYFFDQEGHMLKDAYQKDPDGNIYYLGKDGAWDEADAVIGWKQDSTGWWFGLYGKDYLKDTWKMINGNWYYFKSNGYIAMNEFVQGYWLNAAGAWKDPVHYGWHKSNGKYWYGVKDGWYAKNGTFIIDGESCSFDKNGYLK